MQGGSVVVRNNFNHSFRLQTLHETVRPADRPMKNIAPTPVAAQAFASFTQAVFILTVVVECIRIIDLHQNFQESFYFSFLHVSVFYLLL